MGVDQQQPASSVSKVIQLLQHGVKQESFSNKIASSDIYRNGVAYARTLKRAKRAVDNDKSKRCERMQIASAVFDGVANVASSLSSLGDKASVISAIVATPSYLIKTGLDVAHIKKGCDNIPFDEIKEIFGNRFSQVDKSLNKNYAILNLVYETVNKTLSAVEEIRVEIRQEFNQVLESIKDSRIEPTVAQLNNFISYFESEKERIDYLPKDEYVTKLQEPNNILLYLKGARTPRGDSLRTPLHNIISQKYAIPQSINDEVAFNALYALYYGTQTYVSVMFFLLEQYSYLADYHYQNGNIDQYNQYLDSIRTSFGDFKHSLVDRSSKPLIDDVIDVLHNVQRKDFIISDQDYFRTYQRE